MIRVNGRTITDTDRERLPRDRYQLPSELKGWDYVLDRNDGVTVLCAYDPHSKELRVNPDRDNDLDEIIEDLNYRPGCLLMLLTLGTAGKLLEDDFEVEVDSEIYHFDSGLKKAGILLPNQKHLVRVG